MKQSGLRADPEKVRAFVDRNRQPLKPGKPLERKTPLRSAGVREAAGREGMRSAGLRLAAASAAVRAEQPPRELTMAEALRTRFQARRPARDQHCFKCNRQAHAWHHWASQEVLKAIMRGLARAMGWSPTQTRRTLRRWLRDERNLSPVCTTCHGNTSLTHAEFSAAEVPAQAVEFARELDDMLEAAGRPREVVVRLSRDYR